MTVIIRPSWPYLSPLLHVPGVTAWHADQERLCIWNAEDNSQRWTTVQGIFERIDEWVRDASEGFAAVENARNPEIYWEEPFERVAALVDLEELIGSDRADGQHGEFQIANAVSGAGRTSPIVVLDLIPGPVTPMSPLPFDMTDRHLVRGRWFFRQEIPHPPRTLTEMRRFLTDKQRDRLDRDLRDRPVLLYALVWPNRAGLVASGVLAIRFEGDELTQHLVVFRPKGSDAMLLRAGPDAAVLQAKSVTVLGVGAIGSHVADGVVRAGVGRLRLIDYDRLWPVNLIRHAAPPTASAGLLKTDAMKEHLGGYPWVNVEVPQPNDGIVWTLEAISDALASTDLTIEATGHGGLAELIGLRAQELKRPLISVALFRGGSVARVRRQTQPSDTPLAERRGNDRYPTIPPLDDEIEYVGTETGCLAPVHNAPPVSVALAAALAVESAIDHLTDRHEHPDETIEVIRIGEPPFHRLGRLRPDDLTPTVDISERAQETLRSAARAALPRETGGVLLGCRIAGRATISDVVEVEDVDSTETSYTVKAGVLADVVERARSRDSRLGYLGEWHSHPEGGEPSMLDLVTMSSLAFDDEAKSPAILVIVAPNKPRHDQLAAFVAVPPRLKPISYSTSGDLPPLDEDGTHE